MQSFDLTFQGLRTPVRLEGIADPELLLRKYFTKWRFTLSEAGSDHPWARISHDNGLFRITTAYYDAPRTHKTEVNTICDVIALAARVRAEEQDQEMCLHAAAVLIDGKLLVFPALRRAGKSMLTEALAARGFNVFGDDVLSVTARAGQPYCGIASGAPIRLRLPLPQATPTAVAAHIKQNAGPTNGQYLYVNAPEIKPHGTLAPIGAFVALHRNETQKAKIEPQSRGVMLSRLLKHNFARGADAGYILSNLFGMASSVPSFSLSYSRVDDACDVLIAQAAVLPEPSVLNEVPTRSDDGAAQVSIPRQATLVRRTDVFTRELDGELFATNRDLSRVLHLNQGAIMIWTLLEQPITEDGAVAVLQAAFPDTSPSQIAEDAAKAFAQFRKAGLVKVSEP